MTDELARNLRNLHDPHWCLKVAICRFFYEDHGDWRDIWQEEIAEWCGAPPLTEPFTWDWEAALYKLGLRPNDPDPEGF